MGLFEEIDQNQNKFINISTAVELLALHEGSVYKAVMVLLHYKIDENLCCYRQSEYLDFIDIDNDQKEIYSAYEILKDIKSESDLNGGITSQEKSLSHQLREKIKNYYWELSAINELGFWGAVTKKTSIKPIEKVGIPTIQQTEPNIESLNAEISRLRKENEDKNKTVVELQNRINELEADQPNSEIEAPLLVGLDRINQLAQDRQAMARIMAVYLWEQEKHKDKLPKDIALLVMKEMRNYCADGDIPQTTEAMKRIISSVTPEHAKNKRGRPPKKTMP